MKPTKMWLSRSTTPKGRSCRNSTDCLPESRHEYPLVAIAHFRGQLIATVVLLLQSRFISRIKFVRTGGITNDREKRHRSDFLIGNFLPSARSKRPLDNRVGASE